MNSNVNTKLVSVDRSFNVIGPQLWNLLSIHIKCSGSLSMFKQTLKTYMFKQNTAILSFLAAFAI